MSLVSGLLTQQAIVTPNMRRTIRFNADEDAVDGDVDVGVDFDDSDIDVDVGNSK